MRLILTRNNCIYKYLNWALYLVRAFRLIDLRITAPTTNRIAHKIILVQLNTLEFYYYWIVTGYRELGVRSRVLQFMTCWTVVIFEHCLISLLYNQGIILLIIFTLIVFLFCDFTYNDIISLLINYYNLPWTFTLQNKNNLKLSSPPLMVVGVCRILPSI